MIDVPIVDAHVHLWDPQRFRMSWLDHDPRLNRPFELGEFAQHTVGLPVRSLVYVQVDAAPAYGLLEARWAAELAHRDPQVSAIVAFAPVDDGPPAATYLDALRALGPAIKGVRRLIQSEADPDFPVRPDFLHGLRLLPKYGLSFDICVRHTQLARTIEMVRSCPETTFILDHLGKPNVTAGLLDPWRDHIAELARLPNMAACKLSGLVTEADPTSWTAADLAPYVTHVLNTFGEERVMFGGDWPVVTLASSYSRWVTALDQLTSGLSPAARHRLWADNARRVYRLGQAE